MLNGTITKKPSFVILILLLFLSLIFSIPSCAKHLSEQTEKGDDKALTPRAFASPEVVGTINSEAITESSGVAASRCNKDVLWTHNDSGDRTYIYAMDMSARIIGRWKVKGAENTDWEDIATIKDGSGKCFLYIGDIGDNGEKRVEMSVYRVEEPKLGDESIDGMETAPADRIRFHYPDGIRNAETLLVNPLDRDIYVITKTMIGAAEVYKIPQAFNGPPVTAVKIADFSVPAIPQGLITGGDFSTDGRHIVICDYFGGYEFAVPTDTVNFDDVWGKDPVRFDLGDRVQGESVCYSADGRSIFATSEKGRSPLIRVQIK